MRKLIFTALLSLSFGAMVGIISRQAGEIRRLNANEETLLSDVERFQVSDSLHAARVGVLSLTIDQYKKYRSEDARIIREMGIKNRELQDITNAQSKTIIDLRGTVRDSIVFVDREVVDTLRCIDIVNRWFSLHGCTNRAGVFTGKFENRDSLTIVERVKYKRFCGFLWRTRKVKERDVSVVSRNPHTKIMGVEHIEISK